MKFQKNLCSFLLFFLALTSLNCSKDSSVEVQIVGNWKITGYFSKDLNGKETDQFAKLQTWSSCFKDIAFIFKSDGTLTSSKPTNCETDFSFNFVFDDFPGIKKEGKYTLKNNVLAITNFDGNTSTINISLNKNEMVWNISSSRFILTKQ